MLFYDFGDLFYNRAGESNDESDRLSDSDKFYSDQEDSSDINSDD